MKFEYSFIAVTASDGDCYLSNFRPRQCGLFIVILSSMPSLKTVVFFYPLLFLRLLSPRLKYSRLALCMNALPYAPYFRQRFASFFRHWRRSQDYPYGNACISENFIRTKSFVCPKNSLLILCTNSYVVNTKIRIIIIFKTDFLSVWQFVTHKSIKHCTDAFIAEKLEQN